MVSIVTGAAGFIGMHLCERLLSLGDEVIGVDCFTDYYDPALKAARAARLDGRKGFTMIRADIADADATAALFAQYRPRRVVHLAAQAGVRYSIENPFAYEHCNLAGHLAVLEACRRAPQLEHLVYASSSSVYGDRPNSGEAFREDDAASEPVSLYAATKRACELMSFSYAKLYGFPQTGLRFFTVYGPWGRPDMAYYLFTEKILAGEPIEVYGHGAMARDFTYIDDIIDGVLAALERPPAQGVNRILNIGGGCPEGLMEMIELLETNLGAQAQKIFKPMQPGDVARTSADLTKLKAATGYAPRIRLAEGLPRFVSWYRQFHGVADDR
jgi:UDP-glucuronate 4-epimerase